MANMISENKNQLLAGLEVPSHKCPEYETQYIEINQNANLVPVIPHIIIDGEVPFIA